MTPVFDPKRVRQSELLQLLLLDTLYSLSGSHQVFFHGGTALRWIHGGPRFSEDLDFVTNLPTRKLKSLLEQGQPKASLACTAQFGPGRLEQQIKSSRKAAFKAFCIYRPQAQRERIAVKLEFERLATGQRPETAPHILRDLPTVSALMAAGQLVLPYMSSITITETPLEILTDKIRALYERVYVKGRDVFDLWWLVRQLQVIPTWSAVHKKLEMYQTEFKAARKTDYFQDPSARSEIRDALESDLPRFIPPNILGVYRDEAFKPFIDTTAKVTARLIEQGLGEYLDAHQS